MATKHIIDSTVMTVYQPIRGLSILDIMDFSVSYKITYPVVWGYRRD